MKEGDLLDSECQKNYIVIHQVTHLLDQYPLPLD
jgi:hypothetical protein